MKRYFVYMMSNKSRRLYLGMTSDLAQRVLRHKNKRFQNSFTARYNFDMLVFYEEWSQVVSAIEREKEIKKWRREKKVALVIAENPDWADLNLEWQDHPGWKLEPEARPRIRPKKTK